MTRNPVTTDPASQPRVCSSCGGGLPGPASHCPRCGAPVTGKKRNSAIVIVVVVLALLGAVPCLGIVAAIAIPNFIRYQLRAKQSEIPVELSALVKGERIALQRQGRYVAIGPVPSGAPGPRKAALSAEELEAAMRIDWIVPPTLYGQYAVAVGEDEQDGQAASFCAEADLDGDGKRSVHAAFLPLVRDGEVVGAPPAPCTEPIPFSAEYQAGEVIKLSAEDVF